MKGIIRRILGRFDLDLRRKASPGATLMAQFPDLSVQERDIVLTVRPFTMASSERIVNVINSVKYLVRYNVPGAIVECGVWRGGCMMAAALTLRSLGDTGRHLYLYDTYEGMSAPGEKDRTSDGAAGEDQLRREPKGTGIWCYASFEDVRQNLLSTGYPEKLIHFVRGKVEDTIPAITPETIALLRLDTDWFESTHHELTHLYPRVPCWGTVIIDDYGHWQGAREAVDTYLGQLPHPTFLHRIDYTGRMLVKAQA